MATRILRCFTVDLDGTVKHGGWKVIQAVSSDSRGYPITHVVIKDDFDTQISVIWPAAQIFYFWTEG